MDGVGPELKRRANQLFRHNLTGILEGKLIISLCLFRILIQQSLLSGSSTFWQYWNSSHLFFCLRYAGALRASNAQFEPSYVLDRIGIRLLEAAAGDSGWEIFSLDYSIDAPLNAVSWKCFLSVCAVVCGVLLVSSVFVTPMLSDPPRYCNSTFTKAISCSLSVSLNYRSCTVIASRSTASRFTCSGAWSGSSGASPRPGSSTPCSITPIVHTFLLP